GGAELGLLGLFLGGRRDCGRDRQEHRHQHGHRGTHDTTPVRSVPSGCARDKRQRAWPFCGASGMFRGRQLPPAPPLWQKAGEAAQAMSTEMDSRRRTRNDRAFLAALAFAGGLLAAAAGASAQPRDAPPPGSEQPDAANPAGARYIPGVGFRFVPPPNYVYGYRTRVYG